MKRFALAALVVLLSGLPVAFGQATDSPPEITDVSMTYWQFAGSRTLHFGAPAFGYLWNGPIQRWDWADPNTPNIVFEYDFIWIVIHAKQTITVSGDPNDPNKPVQQEDVTWYDRISVTPFSASPPDAAAMITSVNEPGERLPTGWNELTGQYYIKDPNVTEPNQVGVIITVPLGVPRINGPSVRRLRGLQRYDCSWLIDVEVATTAAPADNQIASANGYLLSNLQSFLFVQARLNPLLLPPTPPPFANAGRDVTVPKNSLVTLDASATFDSGNVGFDPNDPYVYLKDTLTYKWQWFSGPVRVDPNELPNPLGGASAYAQVRLPQAGKYVFRVYAWNQASSRPSTADVTVTVLDSSTPIAPEPPIARVIQTPSVAVAGQSVTLSGAGSLDPDPTQQSLLTYQWKQVNAVGADLAADQVQSDFQAVHGLTTPEITWIPQNPGTYYFALVVTNPAGLTGQARATVRVLDAASAAAQKVRRADLVSPDEFPTYAAEARAAAAKDTANATDNSNSATPTGGCGAGGLWPLGAVALTLGLVRRRRP